MARKPRSVRKPVALFIAGKEDDPIPLGSTRNISETGIYLITQQRPAVGSVQRISIVWGDDALFCDAKVVRHGDDGLGATFLEPGPGFIEAIEEIIDGFETEG